MSTSSEAELSGPRIIAALKQSGVSHVLSVPDITTSEGLLWPISRDPDLSLIRVCKEDEAVGIAAGLAVCDRRAAILIQNTGFFYALNAIRAVAMEYHQPICLLIGLLLKEPDRPPEESASYGVRLVKPVLEALGMSYHSLESDADIACLAPGIARAYETSTPQAFLIGRTPAP